MSNIALTVERDIKDVHISEATLEQWQRDWQSGNVDGNHKTFLEFVEAMAAKEAMRKTMGQQAYNELTHDISIEGVTEPPQMESEDGVLTE